MQLPTIPRTEYQSEREKEVQLDWVPSLRAKGREGRETKLKLTLLSLGVLSKASPLRLVLTNHQPKPGNLFSFYKRALSLSRTTPQSSSPKLTDETTPRWNADALLLPRVGLYRRGVFGTHFIL